MTEAFMDRNVCRQGCHHVDQIFRRLQKDRAWCVDRCKIMLRAGARLDLLSAQPAMYFADLVERCKRFGKAAVAPLGRGGVVDYD